MQLTRGADYGARAILRLATYPTDAVVLVKDIAQAEGLPESYLSKIFQQLAKDGLVRSHRGSRGGFSLARPAEEINLREIIEAIEGPIALNRCLSASEGCELQDTCPIAPVLAEAQRRMLTVLEGTTLKDLANNEPAAKAGCP